MSTIQSRSRIVSSSCSTTMHRVAEVAQPDQRVDQAAVVALVQADRRLVEHVQRADEARADLAGQPDALRLAAGQRAGRARQREVVEADVEQEAEPGVDLLRHPLGDHPVALGQLERRRGTWPTRRSTCRTPRRCCVSLTVTASVAGLSRAPPHAVARHLAHVALVLLARPVALGALVAALDPRDDALVRRSCTGALAAVAVLVLDRAGCRSTPWRMTFCCLAVSLRPRRVEVDAVASSATASSIRVKYCVWALRHGAMAPSLMRQVGVGDDQLGVDLERGAEPVARRAGAVRRVEREVARRQLLVAARRTSGRRGAG